MRYETPSVEIIEFDAEDVITTSPTGGPMDPNEWA